MNKTIVIFSGFNQRAVIAFIRTLVKNRLRFYIIALSKEDPIFMTDYHGCVAAVREHRELNLEDIIACIDKVKKESSATELFIAPTTEALNRFLLTNIKVLKEYGCCVPLVDELLYKKISDKKTFCELCHNFGIGIPKEVEFSKKNIPFVLKPKTYESDKVLSPPIIVDSEQIFNSIDFDLRDYYCQEYVGGNSYYLLYYFSKNGAVQSVFQENLIQQPNGKSITAARIVSWLPTDEKFIEMLTAVKFWGLIMIEVRIKNGQLCMIEANPRFWGPSQLFVDYGINLFEYFLIDNGFEISFNRDIDPDAVYFWGGGMHEYGMVFHNKSSFNEDKYLQYDIYRRNDTMKIYKKELIDKLIENYNNISKHSQYQILPKELREYISPNGLRIKSRAEQQRLDYVLSKLSLSGKTILDIGANTGFFSVESVDAGAKFVTSYEGNQSHANFIDIAINLLDLRNRMKVLKKYYTFEENEKYDICFLLNVLHHIGDDYGDPALGMENAKQLMIKQLNHMASVCEIIVFQLGFNWKGNRNVCLFPQGTKSEVVDFIQSGTSDYWQIESIGIAERCGDAVEYKDLSDENVQRNDTLGEFLNRPLFIMRSKKI